MAGLLGQLACSSPPPEAPPFTVELRASSAEGKPLAGVAFSIGTKSAGTTGEDGRVVRQVVGQEGSSLRVSATCPPEYEPAGQLPPLRLTRTRSIDAHKAQTLPVEVRCQRRVSDIVVVVKAERGGRLPVLVDGKQVTTTNDDGIAHVLLERTRSDKKLEVGLDTSGRGALKPVSPTRTYELAGRDSLVLFEQAFTLKPAPVARAAAPPRRRIPIRVD